MSPFTMNWHHILRLHYVVAVKKFASRSVARYMHQSIAFVDYFRAETREFIDDAINRIFISWDQ
jgi:hypothetical protein